MLFSYSSGVRRSGTCGNSLVIFIPLDRLLGPIVLVRSVIEDQVQHQTDAILAKLAC